MSCEEGRPPADVEEVMLCVVVSSCTLPGKLNCAVELPQAIMSSSPLHKFKECEITGQGFYRHFISDDHKSNSWRLMGLFIFTGSEVLS